VGDVPGLFLPPPAGAKSNSPKEEHRKNLAAYRSLLVQTAQKAQDDYDKAVMGLSGGAIRLSLTFLKDVVGTRMLVDVIWLLCAWQVGF
jgi:hypothetical protein